MWRSLIGKTVSQVEICDTEVLIVFTDDSEINISLDETGGDYGTPFLKTDISIIGENK